MINRILSSINRSPAMEWFLELPTPAGEKEFTAAADVLNALREKPGERLCIWFPNAPELLMEIRHCAGGYLVKECTDFDFAAETREEALQRVKFQFYYETSAEAEEMLRSFCCGEDALVTDDGNGTEKTFYWRVGPAKNGSSSFYRLACL